ncbi:MAG: hypothetical protein P4L31_08620 [Candidatus Babeliales bacterium]|nr:hypothetical protein [Candidatus Babeliales bacterium]
MKGKGVVGDVLRYIKDQKLISNGLHAIGNPYYSGTVAKLVGLGKKKRAPRKRVQHGGGFLDFLGDIGRGAGSGIGGLVGNSLRGLTGGGRKKEQCEGEV